MRLHGLSLRNFRQHSNTSITFPTGLTGLIGANGAGKTTILEAIAWALYGNSAARGTRDSIRHSRAADNAPVHVELDFELAGHRYRVNRTLRTAEVFLDGGAEPVARTIRATNEMLQRRLGMSRAEFFNTYFTGQKELDVMAALGPVERARFLSRVLGYDRLSSAQTLLREQRKSIVAELNGLRSGMPDPETVASQEASADVALSAARDRTELTQALLASTTARLAEIAPAWQRAESSRERWHALDLDYRVKKQDAESRARDVDRLNGELASVAAARTALVPLLPDTAKLPELRTQLDAMELLAAAESERRATAERVRSLTDEIARMNERYGKLESAPALELEQRGVLDELRKTLTAAEVAHNEARTIWARDRQEAETRLETLRVQLDDLSAQRGALEGLGAESPCPTCGRALGESYRGVLELVTGQLETVSVDVNYYRQRARKLSVPSEAVEELDKRRQNLQQKVAAAESRYARIQAALQEREQLGPQLSALKHKLAESERQLALHSTKYDVAQHRALRLEVARVSQIAAQAATLQATVDREPDVAAELSATQATIARLTSHAAELLAERDSLGFSSDAHAELRDSHNAASRAVHEAELEASEARGAVQRAEQQRDAARQARSSLTSLQTRASALENERSLHDELDAEYADLREELNAQLRPELSEIASSFLESLTDGRYAALELDDTYGIQVLEDGIPKSVLSGGEEDVCNLVLRLAISQMIAERAGQPFSLLILDEIFGSLDESRRDNVLALLRRLHDRFEQVMVITHIEDVREGLDRVLSVSYDPQSGSSIVHASAGGAAGAEAAAWETEQTESPFASAAEDHSA